MKLLEMTRDDEHTSLDAHHKRVAFYSSLISAILAATVAGAMRADTWLHYLLLLVGPVLVFSLATIARDGTFRFYQRFLEAVTTRAKLDQSLGLTDPDLLPRPDTGYWLNESLVPPRYLKSRSDVTGSQEFIDKRKTTGYQRPTIRLLFTFQVIAVVMAVGLIVLAFATASPSERDTNDTLNTPANKAVNVRTGKV